MLTDNQIVQLVLNGEKDAFETIIRRYHKKIFTTAYRIVWNREEAEDLTQEVFLRAYQSLDRFNQRAEFYPWLRKCALNFMLTRLKQYKKRACEVAYAEGYYEARQLNAEEIALKKERSAQLLEALGKLKPIHRVVLSLKAFDGLSYEEIALLLDCSPGTVMSRLNRAREQLREKLRKKP